MNRLAQESSLYLRQHAENPVNWQPWGDDALARARAEDRPILLSVGYSSCHWCHVMAHESFEDPDTAAVMNELFVNVKVDREERPDVDALYMQATLALAGQGGWPMTVFLTPDGRPFYAGTYFPKTARGGLPAFADLCRAISNAYHERRDDVEGQAAEVARRLAAAADRTAAEEPLDRAILDDAVVGLARSFDPIEGGFGGAPKFPPSLAMEFLLRRLARRPDDHNARQIVNLTLGKMAAGGIYDQVGGGFHRYSVDGQWVVPHFEKMLYDNALLARDYAIAAGITGAPEHARIAQETLDYLLREMRLPGGGFAAAQDADSPGRRGRLLRLDAAGAGRAAAREPGPRRHPPLRGHRRGQLRGPHHPAGDGPARRDLEPARRGRAARCWSPRAAPSTRPGSSGPRRRATTRSSPRGTGWRSPPSRTPA